MEPELADAAPRLESLHPREILAFALKRYSPQAAIAFSGAGSVVLIDMAAKLEQPVRVFTLDTGRLHPETYEFIERVRQHYGIALDILSPEPQAVEQLVRDKGLFSFYRDGHQECCAIRKVEPLRRALTGLAAWITGQRRDQNPSTRGHLPVVQKDAQFSSAGHPLVKFNPLARWSLAEVWDYIAQHQIPYHPLHALGYVSIGCQPCTRPVLPGQAEREGRWWWEEESKRECGLHARNVPAPAEECPLDKASR
jgi:phosphoadenosine phosphosulfate reductase